jgi:hypothetical protein
MAALPCMVECRILPPGRPTGNELWFHFSRARLWLACLTQPVQCEKRTKHAIANSPFIIKLCSIVLASYMLLLFFQKLSFRSKLKEDPPQRNISEEFTHRHNKKALHRSPLECLKLVVAMLLLRYYGGRSSARPADFRKGVPRRNKCSRLSFLGSTSSLHLF